MYYGWNNSINFTGIVSYSPHPFKAKNGKDMIVFNVVIPRYNYLPLREGQVREPLKPISLNVIGGENILRLMNKRRVIKGDILSVSGSLVSFDTVRNDVKYTSYYVEPQNILVLKGKRGMKAIFAEEAMQEIYNELLKEVKLVDDTNDNPGNN